MRVVDFRCLYLLFLHHVHHVSIFFILWNQTHHSFIFLIFMTPCSILISAKIAPFFSPIPRMQFSENSQKLLSQSNNTQILISNMDALRQKKQQYLRDKILDQNYDANEFMDYCEGVLGSVDIDEWSYDQLVQIVQDYIASTKKVSDQSMGYDPKVSLDSDVMNQFSQWNIHIQQVAVKKQQPKFQLNLFDLDFLQGMSGGSSNNASGKNSPYKHPPQPKTQNKQNYMSVPANIVKKLQEGNDSFIVAYNPMTMSPPKSKPQTEMKIPKKQIQKKALPELNYVSHNYVLPAYANQSNTTNQSIINPPLSQNFVKSVVCKKIINKSRLNGNEDIVISGHQIINPNVFVPKYVLFFVTVNPQNIQVKRRLKDFENLRSLLKKFFPTTQIPHLQRCSRLSETEPAVIKKQTLFLQSFLNNLIMKKQLRCKLLQQFLLCKDLDLLKKIFKQYEKLSGPRSLQGLFSVSGELELKMTAQNRKYVNEQLGLNQFMQEHFTKMKNLYDTLIEGFEQNVKTIGEIEQLHKNFKQRIKNMNSQFTPEYQCPSLQKSIQRVQLMHKQWGMSFKTQARIIQSQIRHLYRYEQDNVITLNELLKFEQQITSAYFKRSDRDQANRQAYQSKKLDEYKITLQNPSKNITVLYHQAAYMQEKASQQSLQYLSQLGRKLDNKFKLFCTLQYSICQDMETVWKQFDNYYK